MIKVTIPTLPEHLSVLFLEFDDKGYYTQVLRKGRYINLYHQTLVTVHSDAPEG
jgi:hypothetical protein